MSNKTIVGSDTDFRDAFLEGAARAFFVMAYADFVENDENESSELDVPGPGGDWMNCAPTNPPAAYALAGQLWTDIEHASKCSMYVLRERALEAEGVTDIDANDFGHYMAMQYMGHGVSWFDSHEKFEIKIPHGEVSSFSFDEACYRAQ